MFLSVNPISFSPFAQVFWVLVFVLVILLPVIQHILGFVIQPKAGVQKYLLGNLVCVHVLWFSVTPMAHVLLCPGKYRFVSNELIGEACQLWTFKPIIQQTTYISMRFANRHDAVHWKRLHHFAHV